MADPNQDLADIDELSVDDGNQTETPSGVHSVQVRLGSFCNYRSLQIRPEVLAKAGFFCTGFEVKCYSCGNSVGNWEAGDDPILPRWHKSDCHHTHSGVPGDDNREPGPASHDLLLRSLNLHCESDRRKTFVAWPPFSDNKLGEEFAKDGFYFLGKDLMTQCVSCHGIFDDLLGQHPTVNAMHKARRPACEMANGTDASNIPLPGPSASSAQNALSQAIDIPGTSTLQDCTAVVDNATASTSGTSYDCGEMTEVPDTMPKEVVTRQRSGTTPVRDPSGPESFPWRLASFRNGWPNRTKATPAEMSDAGLYYVGPGDGVKCFRCLGGLQNWEFDDDPWVEHAKWFPSCEFMLQEKGIEFVNNVLAIFPGLQRPEGPNMPNVGPPMASFQPQAQPSAPTSFERAMQSEAVRCILALGFPQPIVETIVRSVLGTDGQLPNPRNLLHLVQGKAQPELQNLTLEMNGQADTCIMHARAVNAQIVQIFTQGVGTLPRVTVQKLDDKRCCHICKNALAEIVFMPCQHFVSCVRCSCTQPACLMCGKIIQYRVKVQTGTG